MQSYVFWRLCEQIKNGVELKENGSLQFHRKSAYTVCAWEKCEWVCVNKQFEMFEMSGSFCAFSSRCTHVFWLTSVCNEQITNVSSQSASQWKGAHKTRIERERENEKTAKTTTLIAKDEKSKRANVTRTNAKRRWHRYCRSPYNLYNM